MLFLEVRTISKSRRIGIQVEVCQKLCFLASFLRTRRDLQCQQRIFGTAGTGFTGRQE